MIQTKPFGLYSPAMVRIGNAIDRRIPTHIQERYSRTNLVILYVIGFDYVEIGRRIKEAGGKYIAVQCCLKTAYAGPVEDWVPFWKGAEVVWSYYDMGELAQEHGFRFYHSPLGLDDEFRRDPEHTPTRKKAILTSGHVHGPGAEAILEVWQTAERMGYTPIHLGSDHVEGIAPEEMPKNLKVFSGIGDHELAMLYRSVEFVAGLRYTEGFEMPAAEGLACGAVPIVFDQPTLRHWYRDLALFVPEGNGDELIDSLSILSLPLRARPGMSSYWLGTNVLDVLSEEERRITALDRFNWDTIISSLWNSLP